jgi:hypothetical protein
MKKLTLLLFIVSCIFLVNAQDLPAPVYSKWIRDKDGNLDLVYANKDYCDYYIVCTNGTITDVYPGFNVIQRLSRYSSVYDKYRNMARYKYTFYKGRFPDKLNPDFIYALPIRQGDSTNYIIKDINNYIDSNKVSILVFSIKSLDTIYAARSGIVCLDNPRGLDLTRTKAIKTSILIYHRDYSFAQYSELSKILVKPGEKVKVGQAIGCASKANADKEYSQLLFSIFFLDKNKFNEAKESKYTNILPVFHTQNKGDIKPEEKQTYISELTDEIQTQEMSKKEKKKFEKQKAHK